MPRKRKIRVNVESQRISQKLIDDQLHRTQMMTILENAQLNESYHNKCNNELKQLYEKMQRDNYDDFVGIFIVCLKQLMQKDDNNHYANTGLKFMTKFVTSFQAEDMHPLFDSIFEWILETVSLNVRIRLRLCELVNLILSSFPEDGEIEEFHCEEILSYMCDRLKDVSPQVRLQAIKALRRLQVKEDSDDVVTKLFLFHLESDPSPLVRQGVLTSIARTIHTIPFILQRLWDVDMRVRRSAFVQMSSIPVNAYKTEHRIVLLEQGLGDDSEPIRNIVTKVILPQWLASYNMDFLVFLSNLKLDGNEKEMDRFRTVARLSLLEIFKVNQPGELISVLPLVIDETNNYPRCVPLEKLTIELSVFWLTLIEFFQNDASMSDDLEKIVPDLTTYCSYVKTFSGQINNANTDDQINTYVAKNILFTLIEIIQTYDLIDETERQKLNSLVVHLLTKSPCNGKDIMSLIKISEKLIPTSVDRLQFYVDVVKEIMNPTVDADESLSIPTSVFDTSSEVEIVSVKMKLFELKEEETKCLEKKDYDKLSKINEEIAVCNEQLTNLLIPFLPNESICSIVNQITAETELKVLKLLFYGVCSKMVSRLIPSMVKLYKDVIRVRVESNNMEVRNWALKCTATFSLHYSQLADDALNILTKQYFEHENISVWTTSVQAMFQLILRYGLERLFGKPPNTTCELNPQNGISTPVTLDHCQNLDGDDDECVTGAANLMVLFAKHLDLCDDVDLTCSLVDGFCMLFLHGRYFDEHIMSKLIILFYDSKTDPKVIQILSIFFETLIQQKNQKYLQLALRPTLTKITNDDSASLTIPPILKFIINSTVIMKDVNSNTIEKENPHNAIAIVLLDWMIHNSSNRESFRAISKEMLSLKVFNDTQSRPILLNSIDELLAKPVDRQTEINLKLFKQMVEGIMTLEFSSTQPPKGAEEDELIFSNNRDSENEENENCRENEENEVNENEKEVEAQDLLHKNKSRSRLGDITNIPQLINEHNKSYQGVTTAMSVNRNNAANRRYPIRNRL